MSGPLDAVRDFFVAPSARVAHAARCPAPPAPSFAVLGEARDALAVAAGLVLAQTRGCGLLCAWPPREFRARLSASAGARHLAARLEARGLEASTSGRLARVSLPAPPAEAVAAAQRAVAAANVTAAVALTGPREDDLDAIFALQDVVVLVVGHTADPALVRLAEAGLAAECPVVTVPPPARPARELASAGLLAPPALRSRLAPALEAAR